MTQKQKQTLIGYHANCTDGYTAAWVTCRALEALDFKVDLIPLKYSDEESEQLLLDTLCSASYTELYIVDFSLELDALKFLHSRFPYLAITILDHHKTAFERYAPELEITPDVHFRRVVEKATVILDNAESGASLCYKYFNGYDVNLPHLIAYVKDYDLWQFTLGESTKWINKYIRTIEQELHLWDHLSISLNDSHIRSEILTVGKNLQQVHNDEVRKIVLQARKCTIIGQKGLCVMCPPEFSSDVGNVLALRSGTYGAAYRRREDGSEIWSLRSNGDYDVTVLAKKHGGGGHKNAAGFSLKKSDIDMVGIEVGA